MSDIVKRLRERAKQMDKVRPGKEYSCDDGLKYYGCSDADMDQEAIAEIERLRTGNKMLKAALERCGEIIFGMEGD
jgi:hypothetical protein